MDRDVKGAGCRDGATNAGEGYALCLVVGDVCCGFGNEHEGFFKAVEETFGGFYRALDTKLLVVAKEVRFVLQIDRHWGETYLKKSFAG